MSHNKLNEITNTCECSVRVGTKINSYDLFLEIKDFFEKNTEAGIFADVPVKEPFYIGKGGFGDKTKWYADKWYKCNVCGCLWEFDYPDFPAQGFVGKFEDGKHIIEK